MRSTVSMKTFILTLVIFFIGVSSFFYLFLYRPEINKVAKMAGEVSILKETIEESKKTQRQTEELLNKEKAKYHTLMLELRMIRKPRERPHGLPPRVPPGVRCVDCHLKPAPSN